MMQIVYKANVLTPEEIKIVEGEKGATCGTLVDKLM